MPTIIERTQWILSLGWNRIEGNTALLYELQVIYIKANNKVACCTSVLKDFYHQTLDTMKITEKKLEMMTENFKLKKGHTPFLKSAHRHLVNETLTDELAVALIKENPANVSKFEKHPENLDEFISNFGAAAAKEQKQPKVEKVPAAEKPAKPAKAVKAPAAAKEQKQPKK
jgi:hypothetical protein